MNDEQDFDNNPGFAYEGQEVLSEATPAPPPPFPHNPSPALGPASAVGQTMGAMGGGLASGLMAALPWSQPEVAELARLTEAENQVKRDMMNGSLHPQDADRFLSLLAPRLNSLDQKRKKHQADQAAQAEQAAMEQAQKQAAQQEAIRSIHMQTRAGNAQKLLHTIVDPVTQKVALLYPMNEKGDLKPLFEEKGDALSQELKLPADPDLTFNLQEPPATDQPPELGQLAQQRRQQMVDQFPAGHEHVMTIEEGGKRRQVAFTKNANGTWSGGEGPPERGERDNLGRLTSPAGTDTGLAELKRRALQVAGQPPPANAPAWMQHAYHDKYNGILQKLVAHNLQKTGHEQDIENYQKRLAKKDLIDQDREKRHLEDFQAREQVRQQRVKSLSEGVELTVKQQSDILGNVRKEVQSEQDKVHKALSEGKKPGIDTREPLLKSQAAIDGEVRRRANQQFRMLGLPPLLEEDEMDLHREHRSQLVKERVKLAQIPISQRTPEQAERLAILQNEALLGGEARDKTVAARGKKQERSAADGERPPLELQEPPYSGATGGKPATASSAEDEAIQALLRKEIRLPDPSQLREGSIKNIPRGMRSNE